MSDADFDVLSSDELWDALSREPSEAVQRIGSRGSRMNSPELRGEQIQRNELGKVLKRHRENLGLSKEDVVSEIEGMSVEMLRFVELGLANDAEIMQYIEPLARAIELNSEAYQPYLPNDRSGHLGK